MKKELPLVSIVTPSFNKGRFIEETILSVKNQTYPRIEHIIMDGDSTDDTIEVLKKYEGTYDMQWVSEPDEGQSDAINKGWKMAKGEILAFLNADDTYLPRAVETAVKFLTDHPDVSMIYGDCNIINESGETTGTYQTKEFNLRELVCGINMVPQPTVFFRREVLDEVGYLDTNLYIGMDSDFWLRVGLKFKVQRIPHLLANFREYPETKCASEFYRFWPEYLYTLNKTFSNPELPLEIKSVKGRAYSCAYSHISFRSFQRPYMKWTIHHLLKSLVLDPWGNPYRMGNPYRIINRLGKWIIYRLSREGKS